MRTPLLEELRDLIARHERINELLATELDVRIGRATETIAKSDGELTGKLQGRIAALLELRREFFIRD